MDWVVVLVGLAIVVGLIGVVVPVLPGSLLIAIAVGGWALHEQTRGAWLVFAGVVVLLALGWASTYVIAGRRVAAAGIPHRSLIVAGLIGIVGFFVVPVIGLLLFFPAGLFAMEYLRLNDPSAAWTSALLALRSTALGMLAELGFALTAALVWAVAVWTGVGASA
jgi:uncharacterized protein